MNELVIWQRVEGAVVLAAAVAMFLALDVPLSWGWALALFFAPDLSFAAYLLGPRVGAFAYNLVHVYAFGAVALAVGLTVDVAALSGAGALLVAHSGFDRMLGYGLKSPAGFEVTHLGTIGRAT